MSWWETLTEGARQGVADVFGVGAMRDENDMLQGRLLEASADARMIARRTEDVGWTNLSGSGQGGAYYFNPDNTVRGDQIRRAHTYYFNDPVGRRTIDLTSFYVLGRGIPMPKYRQPVDPGAQRPPGPSQNGATSTPTPNDATPSPVASATPAPKRSAANPQGDPDDINTPGQLAIKAFWNDEENKVTLTGFLPQYYNVLEIQLQGQKFFTLHPRAGLLDPQGAIVPNPRVPEGTPALRVADIPENEMTDIIPHPHKRKIPLFYKRSYQSRVWNGSTGGWDANGSITTRYYRDWRFRTPLSDQELAEAAKLGWSMPPEDQIVKDVYVYAIQINKTSEMTFGITTMNSYLEWLSALNTYMGSRMSTVQALAQLALRVKTKGGPKSVSNAERALSDISRLANHIDTGAGGALRHVRADQGVTKFAVENQGASMEPMITDTGSASAQGDIAAMQGQVAAGAGLGAHHIGNAGGGTLASTTCYSEDTEVLTEEGWMDLPAARVRWAANTMPRVAAYDVSRERINFEAPSAMTDVEYRGEMYAFESPGHSILVTPNHRMLVRDSHGRALAQAGAPEFIEAQNLNPRRRYFVRVGAELEDRPRIETFMLPKWGNANQGTRRGDYAKNSERNALIRELADGFVVAEAECRCGCGCRTPLAPRNFAATTARPNREFVAKGEPMPYATSTCKGHAGRDRRIADQVGCSAQMVRYVIDGKRDKIEARGGREAVEVDMDGFLAYLGLWLGEGSVDAEVSQTVGNPKLAAVQAICAGSGFLGKGRVKQRSNCDWSPLWVWRPTEGRRIGQWLNEHCGRFSGQRRIPEFVFALPVEQQRILLRGLLLAEGHYEEDWETGGSAWMGTTSEQLADDVQRLGTLCGMRVRYRQQVDERSEGFADCWILNFNAAVSPNSRARATWSGLPPAHRVGYEGRVWCLTLPSSTVVTRHQKVVALQGNSIDAPTGKLIDWLQELVETIYRDIVGFNLALCGLQADRLEVQMPPVLQRDVAQVSSSMAALIPVLDPRGENRALYRFVFGEILDAMGKVNTPELLNQIFGSQWQTPFETQQQLVQQQFNMQVKAQQTGTSATPTQPSAQAAQSATVSLRRAGDARTTPNGRAGGDVPGGPGNAVAASQDRARARNREGAVDDEAGSIELLEMIAGERTDLTADDFPPELRDLAEAALAGVDEVVGDGSA
jgi:hypothetical protein